MQSQLFRLFDLGAPSYFVLLITGFLFAAALGVLWAKRIGRNPDVVVDLALGMLLAGVAGARIMHVLVDGYFWDYVHLCTNPSLVDWQITKDACLSERYDGIWDAAKGVCHPKESDCFAWAYFWAGGLTYYGGFVGASVVAWFLLKRDRFPFWKAADMAGFAIPIGLAFGRMGCLLAGCCFGVRNDGPLGLIFPPGSPASESQFKLGLIASTRVESLPVLPAQLGESIASLAIAAFCLLVVHPRKRYDGHVFVVFVVLYAVARFLLEFFRADDRGGILALSTSQWVGVVLVVAAGVFHFRRLKSLPAIP
jgi:phosphatidylglycerol:prolipoprotein diacylglycerol transferase